MRRKIQAKWLHCLLDNNQTTGKQNKSFSTSEFLYRFSDWFNILAILVLCFSFIFPSLFFHYMWHSPVYWKAFMTFAIVAKLCVLLNKWIDFCDVAYAPVFINMKKRILPCMYMHIFLGTLTLRCVYASLSRSVHILLYLYVHFYISQVIYRLRNKKPAKYILINKI